MPGEQDMGVGRFEGWQKKSAQPAVFANKALIEHDPKLLGPLKPWSQDWAKTLRMMRFIASAY